MDALKHPKLIVITSVNLGVELIALKRWRIVVEQNNSVRNVMKQGEEKNASNGEKSFSVANLAFVIGTTLTNALNVVSSFKEERRNALIVSLGKTKFSVLNVKDIF